MCGHRNWWYAVVVGAQDVALRTPAADILCITHTKALLEDQTREDINCAHTPFILYSFEYIVWYFMKPKILYQVVS